MTRVAIIAAMTGELKPLVRGWRHESRDGVNLWRRGFGESVWIAACAGMGADAAKRAFAEIEKEGPVDFVLSVGWAGALREEFAAGRAYLVSGVIDARTGERFPAVGPSKECLLVSGDGVADQAEKRRLSAVYGAGLVDMEAAEVARLAAVRGIPFCCIKGVSDGVADPLPDLGSFISASGKLQWRGFILFAFLRPRRWPALMRIGKASRKAASAIREPMLEILERLTHAN